MIPPSVRRIEDYAFAGCLQLAIVDLGKGLEEIRKRAFRDTPQGHHPVGGGGVSVPRRRLVEAGEGNNGGGDGGWEGVSYFF